MLWLVGFGLCFIGAISVDLVLCRVRGLPPTVVFLNWAWSLLVAAGLVCAAMTVITALIGD